ncbi:NUDIX hydrolase [Kutzneria kofuensis]|uniref:NUDIX hydrolase n=1 Tax=Kutzneria kofuensis TaxID=103725 RepID=UPI00160B5AD0|nr:NUDIX domain-containing protein [Kutzneria kofuensis]
MVSDDAQRTRCVGGIAHDSRGRLLLVKRGKPPGQGLWSIPGGRVEQGESDERAVERELLEETGLRVIVGHLIGSVVRPAPVGVFDISDYSCQAIGGALRPGDDAADAAWVDAETFATLERRNLLTEGLVEALTSWNVLPR